MTSRTYMRSVPPDELWDGFTNSPSSNSPRTFLVVPLTLQTPSLHRMLAWRRNVDLLSIVYAFRPRLRYRLTLGGITFPRKPYAFGEQDSHLFYRYSFRHNHLDAPPPLLTVRLVSDVQRSPTD